MKTRFNVMNILQKVDSDNTFYYFSINNNGKNRNIYIDKKLRLNSYNIVNDTIDFPVINAKFVQTKKGTILLVPDNDYMAFIINIKSGFRGYAFLDKNNIKVYDNNNNKIDFQIISNITSYHSPKGTLGMTDNILINIPKTVKRITIPAYRTGRRIDNNNVIIAYDFNLNSDYPVTKTIVTDNN